MCRHAFLPDLARIGCWRLDDCSPVLPLDSLLVTSAGSCPEMEEVNTKDEPPDNPSDKLEVLERGETSLSVELNATNIICQSLHGGV